MRRFRIAESAHPYFISSTIVKWLPIFVTPAMCDIMIDSLRYCREDKGLRLHCYVIMPTHIHLIVSSDSDLSALLRDFKKFTAKRIVEAYADTHDPPFHNVFRFCGKMNRPPTDHKVWQDGNHPEQILTEQFFQQKVDYIHANPYRKGLITDPLAWKYSSIRQFAGVGDGPIEVDWLDW